MKKNKKTKTTKTKKDQVLTMADLLKMEGIETLGFKKGQEVKGKIEMIKNKAIYIDIGGKTDAVVTGKAVKSNLPMIIDLTRK